MTAWPNWLSDILPGWLEDTNYPARGVGDLDDLQLKMGVGEGGRWVGFINPGWFYANNREQYNYIVKGTKTAGSAVVTGTLTESTSYRPAWGPVLVESASGIPYTQHHNSFVPGNICSWTSAGSGLMYTAIASGCVVTGLRDLTPLMLGSVAGLKDLISNRYYYFDEATRRLWIRPTDPANVQIWVDLLYTVPRIKFYELVVQTDDGIQLSYKNAIGVTLQRGNSIESVGNWASGYIDTTLTVDTGDWVVASYYIQRSFCLLDHKTISYYSIPVSGEVITAYYETSLPDILPAATVAGTQLNFNPLFSGAYRTGYLSHLDALTTPVSGLWTPAKMFLEADKTSAVRSWNEHVKFSLMLIDKNELPVPNYPLTLSISAGTTTVTTTSLVATDGRGEIHGIIIPAASGTVITATCGSLTKSITIANVAPSGMVGSSISNGGMSLIIDETKRTRRGNRKVYVNYTYGDGIPKIGTATLNTKLASELEVDGHLYSKSATVGIGYQLDNPLGVQTNIGYTPQSNDEIYCSDYPAQSPIIKTGEVNE